MFIKDHTILHFIEKVSSLFVRIRMAGIWTLVYGIAREIENLNGALENQRKYIDERYYFKNRLLFHTNKVLRINRLLGLEILFNSVPSSAMKTSAHLFLRSKQDITLFLWRVFLKISLHSKRLLNYS